VTSNISKSKAQFALEWAIVDTAIVP